MCERDDKDVLFLVVIMFLLYDWDETCTRSKRPVISVKSSPAHGIIPVAEISQSAVMLEGCWIVIDPNSVAWWNAKRSSVWICGRFGRTASSRTSNQFHTVTMTMTTTAIMHRPHRLAELGRWQTPACSVLPRRSHYIHSSLVLFSCHHCLLVQIALVATGGNAVQYQRWK